jgi:hypothetical protein
MRDLLNRRKGDCHLTGQELGYELLSDCIFTQCRHKYLIAQGQVRLVPPAGQESPHRRRGDPMVESVARFTKLLILGIVHPRYGSDRATGACYGDRRRCSSGHC